MASSRLPIQAEDPGLARFVDRMRQAPYLAPEEEERLFVGWRAGDRAALSRLVESHMRLVVKMAHQHRAYGIPLADLIGEGTVGLMVAVIRFDSSVGVRLNTYAQWWIRAAVTDYVLANWSIFRVHRSEAQKKLFFSLSRLKRQLGELGQGISPEAVAEVARVLDVSADAVLDMNARLTLPVASMDAPLAEGSDETLGDMVADGSPDHSEVVAERSEAAWRSGLLREALACLTDRERDIIAERMLREVPLTLEDLSGRYGVSRERIRQIEAKAFAKLEARVRKLAGERRGATLH